MMISAECEQMGFKLGQKKLEVLRRGWKTILRFRLFLGFLGSRCLGVDDDCGVRTNGLQTDGHVYRNNQLKWD